MRLILGRQVEGSEHGINYIDALDAAAEDLFTRAKYKHRATFTDNAGYKYVLTRERAGQYLVARLSS